MIDVEKIDTHNDSPVTSENLRFAATHQNLVQSWIFDVLTGMADALDESEKAGTDDGTSRTDTEETSGRE